MNTAGKNRSEAAKRAARAARKSPSAAEDIAWQWLRKGKLGFKFRREHPVLNYRIDFYCAEAMLAVEFDGEQHDAARDAFRDAQLAQLGIEVMRIPNRSYFMLDGFCPVDYFRAIRSRCEARTGRVGLEFD